MGDSSKLTGFEALEARLEEIESGDTESVEENKIAAAAEETIKNEVEDDEEVEDKAVEKEEAESEIEAKSEEDSSEGETEKKPEENVYSPNYQYKFQDKFFDFDDRVKSAIKSKEDEEYFRDLYTKSNAMDLMKERAEETAKNLDEYKHKYSEVEAKASEGENIVTYFSGILDGINRGDSNAVNQLLSLSNVNENSLRALGEVIANHLENPQGLNNTVQQNRMQYQQQTVQRQSESYEQQQMALAKEKTEFEVQKAINNPEISDLVKYVDDTWGAGTFEKRVWSEGEAMEAQGKNLSFNEIPNLVKNVADWFGKARPTNPTPANNSQQPPVEKRVVNNPTPSLPNLKGDSGVPEKSVYKDGAGLEGLSKRYREVTGESEW